jgi:hypothetical protein
VRPALQFESLIETMFTLGADGKTNRNHSDSYTASCDRDRGKKRWLRGHRNSAYHLADVVG